MATNLHVSSFLFKLFWTKGVNCAPKEHATPNHANTMTKIMAPIYGVEVAKDSKPKIINY
jgi:hypothetical protein